MAPYDQFQPLLFSIAYGMLGSVSEAEDIVQEAFLRYHRAQQVQAIDSPKAFLATITTNLSIDHLRAARTQREQYIGPWLPEPLVAEATPGAAEHAETADSLSLALLVVLETLSPVQRAIFLLHEVFDYSYDEIAPIVGKTESNCRQLAARARRHVDERKPRFEVSHRDREKLAERFFAAVEHGDTDELIELLAADVVMYGDGGGKAPAAREPLYGRDRVARFIAALATTSRNLNLRYERVGVNGQPGALFFAPDGLLVSVLCLDISGGRVQIVRSMVNPDKIAHLAPVADVTALLRGRGPRRSGEPGPEAA
jgi:RNA polymerase sigma-70 factor, ECF subfamily